MASLSYDVIVLGDDFTGLLAATLCAARGMRVLLAQTRKATPTYRLGKETLPAEPLVLVGLDRPGIERVVAELNFDHLMRRRLVPRDPPLQLLGPRLRLELHQDEDRLSTALQREAQVSPAWMAASEQPQADLDALLDESVCMPGTGFWERRELSKRMPSAHAAAEAWMQDAHSDSEDFLVDLCHLAATGGAGADALSRARSTASLLSGVPALSGEQHEWRSLFLEKFQSHSGEQRIVDPQSIETSWGKVTGLDTVDDEVRCEHLIAAMPAHQLLPLLGAKAGKRLSQAGVLPRPTAFRYTLNLIVHASGLPEGLSSLACSMLDPTEAPTEGNYALFSTRPAASPGKAILSIEGLAPTDESGGPAIEGMREALLDHALDRMPFLDAHIEQVDSPHEEAEAGSKRDLSAPLDPRPVWKSPTGAQLQIGCLPYAGGVKQLWLASEQTLPSLGLEGQFIAAYSAAKLASVGASKGKSSGKPTVLSAPGN